MKGKLAIPLAGRHDWATPQALFDRLNAEFGFTVDVCALPDNAKCARFFTPEDDGLQMNWRDEIAWMNPPYGLALRDWMYKAYTESRWNGATVVCLVPSRTDTKWWHEYAEKASERRFVRGRVAFSACGGHSNHPPFASAIIIFRPAVAGMGA